MHEAYIKDWGEISERQGENATNCAKKIAGQSLLFFLLTDCLLTVISSPS